MNYNANNDEKDSFWGMDWILVVNYITGKAGEKERTRIDLWKENNPEGRAELETFQRLWNSGKVKDGDLKKEEAWKYIQDVIEQSSKIKNPNKTKYFTSFIMYAVKAAAVILILIGGYAAYRQFGLVEKQVKSVTAWNIKATLPGEKSIITLRDNSKITLNAGSTLRYPVNFDGSKREVFLEGEAFFEIQRDTSKPFIVHSGKLSVSVLGTVFNVNAFPGEKNIIISLISGSVKVSKAELNKNEEIVVLKPNQQVSFDKNKEISSFDGFDVQETTGWKDNVLIFKKELFSNVLTKLERTFGIKFELSDKSFGSKKITANFKNETFWTISETLKRLTGLQYKTVKENNEIKRIVFYKNKLQ